MSDYIHSCLALGSQLDGLSLAGTAVVLLLVFAICRRYYVQFATPPACPVRPWYPVPDDLPTGPVAPYGAPAIKAGYRPNMAFGVGGSAAVHLTFILAALLTAQALRKPAPPPEPPIERPIPTPGKIVPPPPLDPSHAEEASSYVPGPPPPPMSRIPIPVADYLTTTQSTILSIDEVYLGPDDLNASDFSIWGHGHGSPDNLFGNGPGTGTDGANEAVVSLDVVERLPELITIPQPDYPEEARISQTEGTVHLKLLVGRDGRVKDVRIAQSIPMLDESARAAALRAVFRPALWRNEPVAVWVTLPIRFSLREP